MTKKQAVKKAIHILEEMEPTEELRQVIHALKGFDPVSYRRKWTKQSCYEAVELWSRIHGRYPTAKEMECLRELPGASVIRREYRMTLRCFMDTYFPSHPERQTQKQTELFDGFVEEYERIRPSSAGDYNARRSAGAPSWNVTARKLGVTGWRELLLLTGVDTSCLKQQGAIFRRLPGVAKKEDPYEIHRHN